MHPESIHPRFADHVAAYDELKREERQEYFQSRHFWSPRKNRNLRKTLENHDWDEANEVNDRWDFYHLPLAVAAERLRGEPHRVAEFLNTEGLPGSVKTLSFAFRAIEAAVILELEDRGIEKAFDHNHESPPQDLNELSDQFTEKAQAFVESEIPVVRQSRLRPLVEHFEQLGLGGGGPNWDLTKELSRNIHAAVEATFVTLQTVIAHTRWARPEISPEEAAEVAKKSIALLTVEGRQGGLRALAVLRGYKESRGQFIRYGVNNKEAVGMSGPIEACPTRQRKKKLSVGEVPHNSDMPGCPALVSRLFKLLWERAIQASLEAGLLKRELDIQKKPPIKRPVHLGSEGNLDNPHRLRVISFM